MHVYIGKEETTIISKQLKKNLIFQENGFNSI